MLPFTHQQFVLVFSLYNSAIWPLQPIVHGAGLLMLALLLRPSRGRDRLSLVLLAAMRHFALWASLSRLVRFGSLADIRSAKRNVRFSPESRHLAHPF